MKKSIWALAALILTAAVAVSAAPDSGLKVGAKVGAFDVVDVSGPNKGKQLCYRCSYGISPVVAAFIKADPKDAAPLVTAIQKLTEQHKAKNLKSFVVFMGGQEMKASIEKVAAEKGITVPMTFLPQGTSAPDIAAYKINPEAKNTVLLWNNGTVQANFVDVGNDGWKNVAQAAEAMLR